MELKKQFLKRFLESCDEDWFIQMSEQLSHDRGEPFDPDDVAPGMSEWMESRLMKNRGAYDPWLQHI